MITENEAPLDSVQEGAQLKRDPWANARFGPERTNRLRLLTLCGLFLLISGALLNNSLGLAHHWFVEDFPKTVMQAVVSPGLGALSAIIGYLFAERQRH